MEDHNYGEEQRLVVNSFQQGFTNKRNQKNCFVWNREKYRSNFTESKRFSILRINGSEYSRADNFSAKSAK